MMFALRWLASRWCISFIGTALLAGMSWVFAPLLPAFEDTLPRLALVLGLLLVWGLANLLLDLRRRRREAALSSGLTADASEEAAAVRDKLTTALRLLKRSRRSRGFLYEQPWYAIIGPPGAGKTTALLNAGLSFPLAAQMGQGAVAGVGGTRQCEWWFTDDAVLIDTAGRYTTQDSDAAVDRAGWEAFLGLLRRTRPRQPLNGVLVAIALSEIAQAPPAERAAHASAIRARVAELEQRLGVRLPVYALFTKADLIAGFTQFFDDLDDAQRAEVWGTTFALGADLAGFTPMFRSLVERLQARLWERLQAEPSVERRAQIALFPAQVASLETPLAEFLQAAFGGAGRPLLRGVYLTSGTQEGTPFDRLIGTMARSFGIEQRRLAGVRPGQGRSYFLSRLLREVIFGEAMLVARDPAAARRRTALRTVGYAVAAVLLLAVGGVLWRIQSGAQAEIDAAEASVAGYEQTAQALPLDPVADADLPRLLPLLNQARALPHGYDSPPPAPPPWWTLGLAQDAKLAAAARAVYRHALERALLPRLVWRLEAQLRGKMGEPDFLYEATRIYLMLGNGGPLDRELVHEWMSLDWQSAYPGDDFAATRAALLRHLDALLAEPLPSVALDGDLVAQARATFAGVSLAQRAYSRVRPSAAAQRLPPWRPSDALGPAGVALFLRASGKPLDAGIPGFFTVEGFHGVFLPSLATVAASVAAESWVLGQRIDLDPNGPQLRAMQREMLTLYETDYARAWDDLLADLNVVPLRSLPRAAQGLYILESPESPLRGLLVAIARQLHLSQPPGASAAARPAPVAVSATASDAERLRALLGGESPTQLDAMPAVPGEDIDKRYSALLTLVGDGPGAPLDQALRSLIDLQQQIAKMAAAPVGAPPPQSAGTDPAALVQAEAARQPLPLSRWLASIASSGIALRGGSPRGQVVAVYNGPGGGAVLCPAAVAGHFPFVRGAGTEIPLAEFSQLFAPGGVFDGFVNTLLRPYVDMSAQPWKPQTADGVAAPVAAPDIGQFQRAAGIRDAFFAGGGTTPGVRFDITPLRIDRASKQVTLDLGGTSVVAAHDTPRATQLSWPLAKEGQTTRLTFDPPLPAKAGAWQEDGPWSLFRLFSRGKLSPATTAGHYTLSFQVGDREAAFDIHPATAVNPFDPGLLQDFRCPQVSGS